MSIDRQLYDFFPHTIEIYPYTGQNNYGEESTGTRRIARAYVEPNITRRRSGEVTDQVRGRMIWVYDLDITVRDRIVLEDGTEPQIRSIAIHCEVDGLDHAEVELA